eukprot:Hpha_TRINITY_DN16280_c1_g4::TRINITY_DN16280_c1_g4_i1::g.16182::m.16182
MKAASEALTARFAVPFRQDRYGKLLKRTLSVDNWRRPDAAPLLGEFVGRGARVRLKVVHADLVGAAEGEWVRPLTTIYSRATLGSPLYLPSRVIQMPGTLASGTRRLSMEVGERFGVYSIEAREDGEVVLKDSRGGWLYLGVVPTTNISGQRVGAVLKHGVAFADNAIPPGVLWDAYQARVLALTTFALLRTVGAAGTTPGKLDPHPWNSVFNKG